MPQYDQIGTNNMKAKMMIRHLQRKAQISLQRRIQRLSQKMLRRIQQSLNQSASIPSNSSLNIGGGMHLLPNYFTVDYANYGPYLQDGKKHVWNYDIQLGFNVSNDQIDSIYCSHTLEHFEPRISSAIVGEFFRILKPGGGIRIVLPETERILDLYSKNRSSLTDIAIDLSTELYVRTTIPKQSLIPDTILPADVVNFFMYDAGGPGGHKCFYDYDSLKLLMKHFGFVNIQRSQYQEGLDVKSHKNFSFYVEATKPTRIN